MEFLGRRTTGEARVYFASGTSIVYWGIREKSLDVDLKAEGEEIGKIIREAKRELNLNIEPEHPGNFIPLPESWRTRSPFIEKIGDVQFFHMDPYAVVISKLVRSTEKDLADVKGLIESGKVDPDELGDIFFDENYQDRLRDQFSLDPDSLATKIKEVQSEFLND
jgi:hypothetical protein